jgi:hypothetical protein
MKPKKLKKKLSLSKETIANLNSEVLRNVRGGVVVVTDPCPVTGKTDCDTNCIHSECYHYSCAAGCTVTCEPCVPPTITICTIDPLACTIDPIICSQDTVCPNC